MEPGQFKGTITRTFHESTPWWPEPPRPPDGAPNVVIVVLDDTGFAQLGCFGSDIATPTLDRLALNGLRFSNFHTTALCSPTRSCVLTGRNHHANGMGRITDLAMGFPGYDATIPRANSFLSEMLLPHGYATYAVGKWHLTPEAETHQAATRARWPLGRGFERFYGFHAGETHQFAPALVADNHQISPPRSYAEGYHLTEDLTDQAIGLVRDLHSIDPAKPFFLYFATGACHSPHQSPPAHLERYRGRFDGGWDVWREKTFARQQAMGLLPATTELSPRPEWVPAWDSLGADEQRLYARFMEAFAAFLTHTDEQVGRLVDALDELGVLDDTLLFVLSDNGASSEGGPTGSVNDNRAWNMAPRKLDEAIEKIELIGGPYLHNNYPWGWTVAGNTPFRRWKREVHEGGVCDPLIVHWPRGITDAGAIRRQYVHAIDIAPTVLDIVGIPAPDTIDGIQQRPLDGASIRSVLLDRSAAEVRTTQYFEMFGCCAIYDRGWKAVTYQPIQLESDKLLDQEWELYEVTTDPSECHDLAATQPDKLAELVALFWHEAERHQVLPLDNRPFSELVFGRPTGLTPRSSYVYSPDLPMVPEHAAADFRNRTHEITAYADAPDGDVNGVLLSIGNALGGFAFYVKDGLLSYTHNMTGLHTARTVATVPVPAGNHRLTMRFTKTAEHCGDVTLLVDDEVVGTGSVQHFTPTVFSLVGAGLTCGYSLDLPPGREYDAPFRFTGTLDRVVVTLDGEPHLDAEAEAQVALTTQ